MVLPDKTVSRKDAVTEHVLIEASTKARPQERQLGALPDKTMSSMDAAIETTGTYLRRVLSGNAPNCRSLYQLVFTVTN